jgi:hypothetical protein
MNPAKLSMGEKIAGVSALVLLISMFLPWYGVDFNNVELADASAFKAEDIIDLLMLLACVATIGLVVAKAMSAGASLPVPAGLVLVVAGGLCLLLVVYRLIDAPGDIPAGVDASVTHKFGFFIGLVASAAFAFGGFRAMSES